MRICSSYEGQDHRDGICQRCGASKEAHGPDDGRIKPTPEDIEILQRQIHRLVRWDQELHGRMFSPQREVIFSKSNLLGTMRRACDDYLHFKPK